MHERRDDRLPEPLERAVSLLRDAPPVRDAWRATLLARVAEPATVRPMSRRWSVSPFVAIAAGIACAIAGAAGTLAVERVHRSPPIDAMTRVARPGVLEASLPGTSTVRFALVAPTAVHVSIVGDFNQWNPTALPLRRLPDGRTWEVQVPLPPGRYTYAFVVDGHLSRDPVAPEAANDDFGVANSVVLVRGS